MSSKMDIPVHEHGVIRLFAIDLPRDQIDDFRSLPDPADDTAAWPLKTALGASDLDNSFIEIFPIANLEGLGLADYLIEGNDVPPDQIDPLRGQLDQLKGHVALVFSSAFGGAAQTLTPIAPLRHVATFFVENEPVKFTPLPDESAQIGSGKSTKKQPSEAAMMGRIATYVLLFMFALTGLIIWIGS